MKKQDNDIALQVIAQWPLKDQLVVGIDLPGEPVVTLAIDISDDEHDTLVLIGPDDEDDEEPSAIYLNRDQAQRLVELLQGWLA